METAVEAARQALTSSPPDMIKALKMCKTALAIQKDCYDALDLAGRAALGLLQKQRRDGAVAEASPNWFDQSEKAFLKATESDPLRKQAWQGLLKLYEQQGMGMRALFLSNEPCVVYLGAYCKFPHHNFHRRLTYTRFMFFFDQELSAFRTSQSKASL